MTVDLDSGTGLFDRLGRLGHVLNTDNEYHSGAATLNLPDEVQDFIEDFDGESNALRCVVDGVLTALTTRQLAALTFMNRLKAFAEKTLIEMVHADVELPAKTVTEALLELERQMIAGSETVDACAVTVGMNDWGSNVGDDIVTVSVKDGRGRNVENAFQEIIAIRCTSGATRGSETWSVKGEAAASNLLGYDYPKGSGASQTITAVHPSNTSGSNVLQNSDFEDFGVADTPDGWTIDTGTASTHIKQDSANEYDGASCLEIDGDGSTLTAISQVISAQTGYAARTPYLLSYRVKVDVVPAAGVLVIDLYDGSSIINDDEGTANSSTVNITSLSTSYEDAETVFRLPDPLPQTASLRVRLSTALSSGSSLFLDNLILTPMTELYAGGPWVSVVSGKDQPSLEDRSLATITRASGGEFQRLFDRLFRTREKGILLPSDSGGSETINENLIA